MCLCMCAHVCDREMNCTRKGNESLCDRTWKIEYKTLYLSSLA